MNTVTKLVCVLVPFFFFACGQASAPAPKAPIFGETVITVSTEQERAEAIQREAVERPQDATTDGKVHLIKVADHKRVVDAEPPTRIFRAIQARTTCQWVINGREDLGQFLTQEDALEAGAASIAPTPDVDGELVVSVGVMEVCGAKQEYASLN